MLFLNCNRSPEMKLVFVTPEGPGVGHGAGQVVTISRAGAD